MTTPATLPSWMLPVLAAWLVPLAAVFAPAPAADAAGAGSRTGRSRGSTFGVLAPLLVALAGTLLALEQLGAPTRLTWGRGGEWLSPVDSGTILFQLDRFSIWLIALVQAASMMCVAGIPPGLDGERRRALALTALATISVLAASPFLIATTWCLIGLTMVSDGSPPTAAVILERALDLGVWVALLTGAAPGPTAPLLALAIVVRSLLTPRTIGDRRDPGGRYFASVIALVSVLVLARGMDPGLLAGIVPLVATLGALAGVVSALGAMVCRREGELLDQLDSCHAAFFLVILGAGGPGPAGGALLVLGAARLLTKVGAGKPSAPELAPPDGAAGLRRSGRSASLLTALMVLIPGLTLAALPPSPTFRIYSPVVESLQHGPGGPVAAFRLLAALALPALMLLALCRPLWSLARPVPAWRSLGAGILGTALLFVTPVTPGGGTALPIPGNAQVPMATALMGLGQILAAMLALGLLVPAAQGRQRLRSRAPALDQLLGELEPGTGRGPRSGAGLTDRIWTGAGAFLVGVEEALTVLLGRGTGLALRAGGHTISELERDFGHLMTDLAGGVSRRTVAFQRAAGRSAMWVQFLLAALLSLAAWALAASSIAGRWIP